MRVHNVTGRQGKQTRQRTPFLREEVPGTVSRLAASVWAYPHVQARARQMQRLRDLGRQGDQFHL
jgi:hypothetical protein